MRACVVWEDCTRPCERATPLRVRARTLDCDTSTPRLRMGRGGGSKERYLDAGADKGFFGRVPQGQARSIFFAQRPLSPHSARPTRVSLLLPCYLRTRMNRPCSCSAGSAIQIIRVHAHMQCAGILPTPTHGLTACPDPGRSSCTRRRHAALNS